MAEIGAKDMERIRPAYDAFNRGDFDAAAEVFHPEIVYHRAADVEQSLEGLDGVRAFMEPDVFTSQHNEVHSIEALGDHILVESTFTGVGAGSGIELQQRGYHLWRVEDGKAIEFSYFVDRDEAIAAAAAGRERG
jgi:ketosteroid isomerase-like protein